MQILYQLRHQGSPWILERVAYPFSSGSSQPRNRPESPALQADSLPTELSGKLKGNKTQQHGPTDLFTPVLILFIVSERASQVVLVVKNLPAKAGRRKRHRLDPWVGKIPWRKAQQPPPVFLPGESQGQRSLAGYGPWGCKELDTTERLSTIIC